MATCSKQCVGNLRSESGFFGYPEECGSESIGKRRRGIRQKAVRLPLDEDNEELNLHRQEMVELYAARVAAGLPLDPADTLTDEDRAELADTDADELAGRTAGAKRGRKPLDNGEGPLTYEKLNRDRRELLDRIARRYRGGAVSVPEWVAPERADDWRKLVAETARTKYRGR